MVFVGPPNGPNFPLLLSFANVYTPFAAFPLDLRIFALPVFLFGLAAVLGSGFVVDALKGLASGFLALLADGKALGECPVLQSFVALFQRGYNFILQRIEVVGRWNGVFGGLDVAFELRGQGLRL